ncbi:hypothetical protein [Rhodocista pekingensis]|uniref:Lipoprotein n=1 Tax=Rhodocista pekingensis TaxID=201185 RepID=A0ABW2KTJ8_9PROT
MSIETASPSLSAGTAPGVRLYLAPALIAAAIAALAVLAACAPDRPVPHGGYGVNEQAERRAVLGTPAFAQFPPYRIVAPEAVVPDLDSHPRAHDYATALRQGAARGATFAGHLAVARWGCGTGCQQWAFIDALDGRVVWGPTTTAGAGYTMDSRLFVADSDGTPRYFVWDGSALRALAG